MIETHRTTALHTPGSFDLVDHPIPSGREEVWRFTPTKLLADFFDENLVRAGLGVVVEAGGVELGQLAVGEGPRGQVLKPTDRTSAIAAAVPQAGYLHLDGQLPTPVRLKINGQGASPSADHLVIDATAGSSATVLLNHTGAARHIGNVEVLVGDGAHLTLVTIQDWEAGSVHLGQHVARVGKDATFRHIAVSLGGDLVRMQTNVSYSSTGGEVELLGVYFADAGQHLEHRLFVDHNRPKGVSHVDYRGALQGEKAHSVWIGDVLIRPEALGIETYESNKNLVLTDGCRVDAVPNLEIETGQINGAGHSASTGRFDDEQLFYLMSRGLSEVEARHLVVRGFFASILARIGIVDVEATLMNRIDTELAFNKEK